MKPVLLAAALLVGACHKDRPPPPTPEQTDQLNEADAMLNAMSANAEGPADRSAGPSNSSE